MFAGDVCWDVGTDSLEDVTLFPLAIPAGSLYLGIEVVENQSCQVWSFDSVKFNVNVTIWVNEKVFNPVRIDLEAFGDTLRWEFTNTVVGPFSPSVYDVPEGLDCTSDSSLLETLNGNLFSFTILFTLFFPFFVLI
eukprot:Phypoly_transcript_17770.p1 GENE.Phypoly_transcript_17770~~Phypoly_transcript_17770.p1  ORF type:complete len:136 (+),score=9.49 Phypoly_transcript_17770:194-601(+)